MSVGRCRFVLRFNRYDHLQLLDDDHQVLQDRFVVDDGGTCFQDLNQVGHVLGAEVRTDEVEAEVDETEAVAAQVENVSQHLRSLRQDDAVGFHLLRVLAVDDDVGELVLRADLSQSLGKLVQVSSRIPLRPEQELAAVWDNVRHPQQV